MEIKCPVCLDVSDASISHLATKGDDFLHNDYWHECPNCDTMFTGKEAPQLIGGTLEGAEQIRNQDNRGRWLRLQKYVQQYHGGTYLDYGCGNGMLVAYVNGLNNDRDKIICQGYDKFNPKYATRPTLLFDGVFLVETIEHLTNPDEVLTDIYSLLKPKGYLYLESSFRWGQTLEELAKWDYMDSALGHSTIISEKGLPILFGRNGFELKEKYNRNSYIWRKIKKANGDLVS